MRSINTRLDEMAKKLSSDELFKSTGSRNEIDFYIFDYDSEDEYIVKDYIDNYLVKKKDLVIIDIYDIIIDILKEKGYLEKAFEFEKKNGVKYVNSLISKTLGIGSNNDLVMKKIKNKIESNQIIIITGIGKCYGIVRGHAILNNLQSMVNSNLLIMFFPGFYDGNSFKLFNKLDNDNYRRACQFIDR